MALLLPIGVSPVGIQQIITLGSQFDGAASTSALTLGHGMNKYATDTKGGLFYFDQTEPIAVHDIMADFGVAVTYTLSVVNLDDAGAVIAGETLVLTTGSAATYTRSDHIVLGPKQALQLVTSGGAGARKIARVWGVTYRGFTG